MEIKSMTKVLIMGIIALVLIVTIIGTTASTVDNASDDITQDQRCGAVGCFWNSTNSLCYYGNVSTSTTACDTNTANQSYPLESLFNTGGIVTLLFIALGLIVTVGIALKSFKK
jgi:hypothetical protein